MLKAVRVDDAYANLVLPAVIQHYQLDTRDAAFTTELASGTLRLRGTYDAILAACVDRPLRKVEDKVLDALRLGAHQLLSMRVPAHAAISTTVNLVHARSSSGAAGFANAVLRKVTERDLDDWIAQLAPDPVASPEQVRRDRLQPPALGGRRAPQGGRAPTSCSTCWPPTTRPPRVTLVARPGTLDPRRAAGRAHGRTPGTGSCSPVAARPRCRRWPRAAPACRTRGRS